MSDQNTNWFYRNGQTDEAAKRAGEWQRQNAPHNPPSQYPGESFAAFRARQAAFKGS